MKIGLLMSSLVSACLVFCPCYGNAEDGWHDFQIIMWQQQSAAAWETLKEIGVTAGAVEVNRTTGHFSPGTLSQLLQQKLNFYIENIATDFYSPYHRYYDGKPANWKFHQLKDLYRHNRDDDSVFIREPSLADPAWLAKIKDRLSDNVRDLEGHRPLYYNLADEPGIADLSANWDFDFSTPSLQGLRNWLKEQYGSLATLNAEWDTHFSDWEGVKPETTDEALAGAGNNFAPWADFKAWMDISFAHAIATEAAALHDDDAQARSGIEGAQIAGSGGWNFEDLAGAVDVMEIYDYADNLELVRSLAPRTALLTTSFKSGPEEEHRVWRELLRGARGLVIWDENHAFAASDGALGPHGRAAQSYFSEIRGGLGALMIASKRELAPIAILYSPESMRVEWIRDREAEGKSWINRNASDEYENNPIRELTSSNLRQLEHMGLQPVFISPKELQHDALTQGRYRVLILPQTMALSPEAAAAIHEFVAQGGVVVGEGEIGTFDQHGRRLNPALLADLLPAAPGRAGAEDLSRAVAATGLTPEFSLRSADGKTRHDVESYIFRNGDATILALLCDLPPNGGETAASLTDIVLPRPFYAYNLRTGQDLGKQTQLTVPLSPNAPTMIGLSEYPFAAPSIIGPTSVVGGGNLHVRILPATTDDVLHVELKGPDEITVEPNSWNLAASKGEAELSIHFDQVARSGTWSLRARDLLSGLAVEHKFELLAR